MLLGHLAPRRLKLCNLTQVGCTVALRNCEQSISWEREGNDLPKSLHCFCLSPCQHRSSARPPLHQYPDVEHEQWPPTGGLDIVQLVCSDGDELIFTHNHYLDDQYQGLAWQQALLPRMPKGGCGHFCSWLRSLLLLLFITAALKNNKFAQQSKQV